MAASSGRGDRYCCSRFAIRITSTNLESELHVLPHNEAAIALYESAGYEREGYRAGQYRNSDSRFVDVILMAKWLQQ